MKFKTVFTIIIFIAFVGLCGFETASNIKSSAKRDISSVRYTSGIETPTKEETKKQSFNLNKILQDTDLNG
ncbi:hypothetical protein [Maridesulfovibrio sp.]|uniref:hypothetical protein n=1 Tax=Maridesulfovibrio sp. TaxID=2795000 RepID=UPI002A189F86|nr:hypothetical protein [Maridesulfovibrio sp.]